MQGSEKSHKYRPGCWRCSRRKNLGRRFPESQLSTRSQEIRVERWLNGTCRHVIASSSGTSLLKDHQRKVGQKYETSRRELRAKRARREDGGMWIFFLLPGLRQFEALKGYDVLGVSD